MKKLFVIIVGITFMFSSGGCKKDEGEKRNAGFDGIVSGTVPELAGMEGLILIASVYGASEFTELGRCPIENGEFYIRLPNPIGDSYLYEDYFMSLKDDWLTVSNESAKGLNVDFVIFKNNSEYGTLEYSYTVETEYDITIKWCNFAYLNSPVDINGTLHGEAKDYRYTYKVDLSLAKGWNVYTCTEKGAAGVSKGNYSAFYTMDIPSNPKWKIID